MAERAVDMEVIRMRIEARIEIHPETGCHLYQGRCTKDGYAQIRVGQQIKYVHRVRYEIETGRAILPNHDLDHLLEGRDVAPGPCRFRNCCNLDHMEEVPRTVNRGERMRRRVVDC